MRTYSELITLPTFEDRLEYLRVTDLPGELTFGPLRDLNQKFYMSRDWKRIRELVISRDLGYDLGVPGREILGRVLVHHMNPIKPKDIVYHSDNVLNPEFLITVSDWTHRCIHFGTDPKEDIFVDRQPGDTKLW